MKTAYTTIKDFEAMALTKGQGGGCQMRPGIKGEVRLIERAFGLGPDAITGSLEHINTLVFSA